jgi:hypothetical protein
MEQLLGADNRSVYGRGIRSRSPHRNQHRRLLDMLRLPKRCQMMIWKPKAWYSEGQRFRPCNAQAAGESEGLGTKLTLCQTHLDSWVTPE